MPEELLSDSLWRAAHHAQGIVTISILLSPPHVDAMQALFHLSFSASLQKENVCATLDYKG